MPIQDCCTYVVPYEGTIQGPLDTPSNLAVSDITTSAAAVSWDSVDDAQTYVITVQPADVDPQETSSTSVDLEGLESNTEYTVSVVATSEDRPDSQPATETFTTSESSGD